MAHRHDIGAPGLDAWASKTAQEPLPRRPNSPRPAIGIAGKINVQSGLGIRKQQELGCTDTLEFRFRATGLWGYADETWRGATCHNAGVSHEHHSFSLVSPS